MRFIDLDLARRVEMAEANAGRECAEACQRCGSEYCEIMTGSRCHKDDHAGPYADNASRFQISRR